jgi:hypothetical protein
MLLRPAATAGAPPAHNAETDDAMQNAKSNKPCLLLLVRFGQMLSHGLAHFLLIGYWNGLIHLGWPWLST